MGKVDFKKLAVVFKREYLERVRSKWFVIGTLLGPVFMFMVMVFPAWMGLRQRADDNIANVTIIDATGVSLGDRIAAALKKKFPQSIAPTVKVVTPANAKRAGDALVSSVSDRSINGFITLDSNTVASKSVTYEGRNASSVKDVETLTDVMRAEVLRYRLETAGLDPERVNSLTVERLRTKTEKIGNKGRETGGGAGNLIFGLIVAMLLYFMIALYGQQILRGVLEEKTTRVAEVVVSSTTPDTLLAGKIIGSGMVAITQVLSWVLLTGLSLAYIVPMVFKNMTPDSGAQAMASQRGLPSDQIVAAMPTPGTALMILAFFVLGFLFYSSLFGAAGAMVSSQEDVQQAAMPVMLMLISSVLFMQAVMLAPNSSAARVMTMIPFSAPILMPLRMSLVAVPWWELGVSLGGVVLAAIGGIWLSARIYRVGLLMYGKRPSFSELAKWVRHAG